MNKRFGTFNSVCVGADLTEDQIEFGRACDDQKRKRGTPTLTCGQILAVAKSLGYRKDGAMLNGRIEDGKLVPEALPAPGTETIPQGAFVPSGAPLKAMAPSSKGAIIRRIMEREGAGITFDQLLVLLRPYGVSYQQVSFDKCYRKLFAPKDEPIAPTEKLNGHAEAFPVLPVVAVEPVQVAAPAVVKPLPQSKTPLFAATLSPLDRLSDFVRFAGAVEAIGGIDKARGYLGLLEQMLALEK